MSEPLRLRADDEEDYRVIAACLQDALAPVGEMQFLPDEKIFAMLVTRFRWENCPEAFDAPPTDGNQPPPDAMFQACSTYERINCGLRFDGVTQVKRRNINPKDVSRILELLTVNLVDRCVELVFAGDMAIRLEGDSIVCRLQDLGESWPTHWRPRHVDAGGG